MNETLNPDWQSQVSVVSGNATVLMTILGIILILVLAGAVVAIVMRVLDK